MIDKNKRVKVTNRTGGSLAYRIESLRVVRHWVKPGDHLNISIDELLELKTVNGGTEILEDCVVIEDKEALRILFPDKEIEPEYAYGLKEIEFLLYEGETAQLLDTLDYAPKGVLDLIKSKSIEKLPNEMSKINAINDKFNIDINKIHELSKEKDIHEPKEEPKRKRRAKPLIEEETPEIPKYNVISKED